MLIRVQSLLVNEVGDAYLLGHRLCLSKRYVVFELLEGILAFDKAKPLLFLLVFIFGDDVFQVFLLNILLSEFLLLNKLRLNVLLDLLTHSLGEVRLLFLLWRFLFLRLLFLSNAFSGGRDFVLWGYQFVGFYFEFFLGICQSSFET